MGTGVRAGVVVLIAWVVAVAAIGAVEGLEVSFADGRVTVIADQVPLRTILDEWSNTSSAGSVIAFHLHSSDLAPGNIGVLCSFGAGYSIGCAIIRRR